MITTRAIASRVEQVLDSIKDRINRHENYVATFTSPQGRKVLEHLCKISHVTDSAFVSGSFDMTAYENGKRDLVLAILRQINKDPSDIIKQIEETTNG